MTWEIAAGNVQSWAYVTETILGRQKRKMLGYIIRVAGSCLSWRWHRTIQLGKELIFIVNGYSPPRQHSPKSNGPKSLEKGKDPFSFDNHSSFGFKMPRYTQIKSRTNFSFL